MELGAIPTTSLRQQQDVQNFEQRLIYKFDLFLRRRRKYRVVWCLWTIFVFLFVAGFAADRVRSAQSYREGIVPWILCASFVAWILVTWKYRASSRDPHRYLSDLNEFLAGFRLYFSGHSRRLYGRRDVAPAVGGKQEEFLLDNALRSSEEHAAAVDAIPRKRR